MLDLHSQLLKMTSVADGEMTDPSLIDTVVDRNGFKASTSTEGCNSIAIHASGLFLRRVCISDLGDAVIVLPEELPVGVQMRVAAITLLHHVIRGHSDAFFDAEASAAIGK
jgi:hypothetical protein